MDATAFETKLRADGYKEIETKRLDPRPANGEHGHRPGEIFEVAAGQMHFEAVGPEGAQVTVGRRY